jgi:hypothetical protein
VHRLQEYTAHDCRCRLALIADEEQADATIAERLTGNIPTLRDCFANVPIDSRYAVCKLHGDACDELAGMANISTAS